MGIIGFCAFRSKLHIRYLLLDVLYLFLQTLVLLLCSLVLLLQLPTVHFFPSPQSSLQELHRVARFFGFLIQLHQDLGQLVDCSGLLQVLLELLFFAFNSTLRLKHLTCDIAEVLKI